MYILPNYMVLFLSNSMYILPNYVVLFLSNSVYVYIA
jgi:hypothetical protein